jgi:excisionase family DNA binding protein
MVWWGGKVRRKNMNEKQEKLELLALTYQQASIVASLSERTIWGLVASGKLRAVRIGRSVRILRSELESFLSAQQTGGEQ